ncbi:DUF6474 family protein [Saccharopolyspora sp. NFXS83]|uniref:DUF6474 family protein n=1 Tax=Saccharopolyspora sp. NFXS83 TaxID=2993560 RepID=UPI00224B3AEA|nr:DUF6474 family protein [Saccharopolyspora sp. NFXS83]MCX2731233.1 DUF6474 family protein [Saccharopolyspora sp. NFXS83]
MTRGTGEPATAALTTEILRTEPLNARTDDSGDDVRSAAKQVKKVAKLEAKAAHEQTKTAKQETKAVKQETKATTKTAKQEAKSAEKAAKRDEKARKKGEHGRFTPGDARKAVGVAKILGPALAPYAWQAFTAARDGYDRARARRLGVAVDDLGRFTGRGAALHARIAGDAEALRELRTRTAGRSAAETSLVEKFADEANSRLNQLGSAVRAAERMPTPRRRAAHRAVIGELDRIEDDLLQRLGIRSTEQHEK